MPHHKKPGISRGTLCRAGLHDEWVLRGRHWRCLPCTRSYTSMYTKTRRATDEQFHEREKSYHRGYDTEWRKKPSSREQHRKAQARLMKTDSIYRRLQRLASVNAHHKKIKSGWTPELFVQRWQTQEGKCIICDEPMLPEGRSRRSVHRDHNHITHSPRALLCCACNRDIVGLIERLLKTGKMHLLNKAVSYLQQWEVT
jgi:recombination endonuclease VII